MSRCRLHLDADRELWAAQGHLAQKADPNAAIDLQYLQEALQSVDGPR